MTQPEELTRTQWLIEYILGPCRCGPEYKDRKLVSPHCDLCNDSNAAREALLLAYQYGHDEQNSALVEGNREALKRVDRQLNS